MKKQKLTLYLTKAAIAAVEKERARLIDAGQPRGGSSISGIVEGAILSAFPSKKR